MLPSSLKKNASEGEKRTFNLLSKLPDDFFVFYEPLISGLYPDFVIFGPKFGVMIVEVKGWYPNNIDIKSDQKKVIYREKNKVTISQDHPLEQARKYRNGLIDECEKHKFSQVILNTSGPHMGKPKFPISYMTILSNISTNQLIRSDGVDLSLLFKQERTLFKDQMEELQNKSSSEILHQIRKFCLYSWPVSMTEEEIKALRLLIFPDLSASPIKPEDPLDKVEILDLKQENLAFKIGHGHRILLGVAGSGKSLILQKKTKILKKLDPDSHVLYLCYNKVLKDKIRQNMYGISCDVDNFHGLAQKLGIKLQDNGWKSSEQLGNELLEKSKSIDISQKYDAILIDEMQDFHPLWLKAITSLLKDPDNGDLIIAGDLNQGIYQTKGFRWSNLGIKAKGRTYYFRSNYRNTKEILKVASLYSVHHQSTDNEDSIGVVPVNCDNSVRTGQKPRVYRCKDRLSECNLASALVKFIVQPKENSYFKVNPIKPNEIGILYPLATKDMKGYLKKLEQDINSFSQAIWLNDDSDYKKKDCINDEAVKISTIASAKGLDFRIVISLFSDLRDFDDEIDDDKTLLYVGLTRARDYLWILYSQMSDLIPPLYENGDIIVAKEYPEKK